MILPEDSTIGISNPVAGDIRDDRYSPIFLSFVPLPLHSIAASEPKTKLSPEEFIVLGMGIRPASSIGTTGA